MIFRWLNNNMRCFEMKGDEVMTVGERVKQ